MNNLLQEAGCEAIFEDKQSDVESSAISRLADFQLALIGGGTGNVLWG
jgi:hypothetical protein